MKFKITDKNGNTYIAKKNAGKVIKDEKTIKDEETIEEKKEEIEEVKLSNDEILALKDLAKKIPDLLKLLDNVNDIDEAEEEKEEESSEEDLDEEVIDFEDDDIEEEADADLVTEEEVETNDCGNNISDSKQSFGSIETKRSTVEVDDNEIAQVWARRYGGK